MLGSVKRRIGFALGVCLIGEAVLFGWLLGFVERGQGPQTHAAVLLSIAAPLWAVAVFLLSRLDLAGRQATVLVLGVGAVFSIIAMTHPPATSDDDFRYIWNAKVQLAGIDPYRYAPSAPELRELREPLLFGAPGEYPHRIEGGSTPINRPNVRTVYPPVAEGAFTAMRLVSFGGHGNHLPLQLTAALGALAIGWLLLRRGPPWRAALWAWCPVTIVEFANNAHIDWLGVLLVVLALSYARTTIGRGVLAGAATAVKLYPALVLPALMRRDWRVALVAVATVALVYVPHVLAVGPDVIGYLPGYLQENKYDSGRNLLLLGPVLGDSAAKVVGVVALVAVALWAWLRSAPGRPEDAALLVVGVAFLVTTPVFGWYAALLLALVALTGALEWVPIVFAASACYVVHSRNDDLVYRVALALAVVTWLVRNRQRLVSLRP